MELVEIRDLDGPNLFLLEPAIKVELRISEDDLSPHFLAAIRRRFVPPTEPFGPLGAGIEGLKLTLADSVRRLHEHAGFPDAAVIVQPMETDGHLAVAFGWSHRRAAMQLASVYAATLTGPDELPLDELARIARLAETHEPDDHPLMVRDEDRRIPIIGVTGTNGKTTTTRLIAHILRMAGLRVGWSSSSGVYIEGERVLEGDYTGPAGARRVLDDPAVDAAVLETARGGILLRGIAYESNDVGVFINVSADHLELHGIRTVEGLARVKSTVVRVTTPTGFAVLNADDELVRSVSADVHAQIIFVSQDPRNDAVNEHVHAGGMALIARDQRVWYWNNGQAAALIDVSDIPITFSGRARHMIENALCAAAACIGVGRTIVEVRAGLASFKSDTSHNLGRLNLFEVDGVSVVVDFAHNEVGLRHLLELAREIKGPGGRIISIIGTAGDRTDEALIAIGQLAGSESNRVIIKETKKYLRGRPSNDALNALYVQGLAAAASAPWSVEKDELAALAQALATARPSDVIVMMCLEQIPEVQNLLSQDRRPPSFEATSH